MGDFLQVELAGRHGPLALELAFRLSAPWTCLFGPSGSGKSTVLRAIAGLVRIRQANIVLGETHLETPAGTYVRASKRRVRSAGQQAWLFPGTVRENVAYGGGASTQSILNLFHLTELAEVQTSVLSGGERQRVNVARAVAAADGMDLLLLDEPFAGMDGSMRDDLALNLKAWMAHRGVPVLSVTHDASEAFLLGADVIQIANGKILRQGPVTSVLAEERSRLLGILGQAGKSPTSLE